MHARLEVEHFSSFPGGFLTSFRVNRKFAACSKPASRDNHRLEASYQRMQQRDH